MNSYAKPKTIDLFILSFFVVLMTFQPFYSHGEINLFEVGLYLPGINALLEGMVPFRDFFHLRGAFEIYGPAWLMSIFGPRIEVMYAYFYVGNIVCLLMAILIGRELYKSRLIFYLMVPVFVARTFPRVVFPFWGGFRYALGLLALYGALRFFKRENPGWMFLAGVAAAAGLLTSVEIGVCALAGIISALIFSFVFRIQRRPVVIKGILFFGLGVLSVGIPYAVYLFKTNSFWPTLEAVWAVIHKEEILDTALVCALPANPWDVIRVMLNPTHDNFRHITPTYFYIIFLCYFIHRFRRERMDSRDLAAMAVAVYGVILYHTAFRNIWAAQFEMALQPQKILLFYLLEQAYLFLRERQAYFTSIVRSYFTVDGKKWKLEGRILLIRFLILGLVMSSLGYSFARFNQRFYTFRYIKGWFLKKDFVSALKPWHDKPSRPLTIDRAGGIIVPIEQADELEQVGEFLGKNTAPNEAVLMYPEYGTYSFLFDRPFVGRFPICTFSWFNENWHREFVAELKNDPPRFVVMPKKNPTNWSLVYLTPEKNRRKYDEVTGFIKENYFLKQETPRSYIYQRNNS